MEWLSLSEVAELEGVEYNSIKLRCFRGYYKNTKTEKNINGGKDIVLVGVDCLSAKAQKRYRQKQKRLLTESIDEIIDSTTSEEQNLEDLTFEQRSEALWWETVLREWRCYRTKKKYEGVSFADADEKYESILNKRYPDRDMHIKTIYRKNKVYTEHGVAALADKRGLHSKGKCTIDPRVWQVFESLWLDENRRSVTLCYELTKTWVERNLPELAGDLQSCITFTRQVNKIPEPVRLYFREGDKACEDKAMPYITRVYDNLESNDIWVGDNHTLDFMVRDDAGELHRFYITTYLDVKSRKITSCYVTNSPDSNSNLYAMRRGFEKYGIPREFYLDNGREFLVHDIGGRGRRKTAKTDEHAPPTILDRLGIKMTNARVRNGRAKIVERTFREVKENFSKLFLSYTGGNVIEKPERLKHILKKGGGVDVAKLNEYVQTWVDGYYNKKAHGGTGMNRMCPDEVFAKNLITKRVAGADELNLMLMRSTRMQKVGRLGVSLTISGEKINYWDGDFINTYQGNKVYVRYDPLDLSKVRVYDEQDKFLREVNSEMSTILEYGANIDDVKDAIQKVHAVKKAVKSYRKNRGLDQLPDANAIDLMMYKAKENIENINFKTNPKILELVRAGETETKMAVGNDYVVDTEKMLKNAIKNRENK